MGSFDRTIAMAKLDFIEKYRKAKASDLALIREVLDAQVDYFDDGKKARVTCLGQTTSVEVIHEV